MIEITRGDFLEPWKVDFSEVQANMYCTAPKEYTLSNGVFQRLKVEEEKKNQQWAELLHNVDPRLTGDVQKVLYWYRLMEDKGTTPPWREHEKYDNVIQFVPSLIRRNLPAEIVRPLTPRATRPGAGVSAKRHGLYARSGRHGVSEESPKHWVSAISILELQRELQARNRYCLVVPSENTYRTRVFQESLSDSNLALEGFWGQSTKVTVSDFRKAY